MSSIPTTCSGTCTCIRCQQAALRQFSPEMQQEFSALFNKVKGIAKRAAAKAKPYIAIAQIIGRLVQPVAPPEGTPPKPIPAHVDDYGRYFSIEEQRRRKERVDAAAQSRKAPVKQKPDQESVLMEIFQELELV